LIEAVPNPFTMRTAIDFAIPKTAGAGVTTLRVYDAGGRIVRVLVNGPIPAGHHVVEWDGRNDAGQVVGPGAYFYHLVTGGDERAERVILVR
jgi:flagellar hook assembly protein FlgD